MGSGLEALKRRHQEFYSDMSFDSFLRKRHQKYYSDMPYEYYLRSLEGPARPGFDPVKVEGTGGEPMEPTEAMMGVTPMKGIEKFYPEIGGTVGGMVAGVPGAAVGGAIGEAGREFAEGEDLSGEKILVEGGIQGLWEKGGRLAEKGITKLLSPSAGKILPETKEAVEHFGKYGGYISPAQQAEGKLIDLAEGVSEASITGGPRFFKFRENQAKAFEATADDLIERMGSSMDEFDVGVLFVEEIGKSDLAFRTQASAFYKNVDRLTAGAGVDLRPLKEFAEEQMEKALAREGIGGSAAGDMLTKKVVKLDDFISFEEADKLRSGFGAEISSFEGKKDAAAGVAKKYFGLTSESMENSAKALGDEAHAAWEKARTFYKEGKATFQSKYMRGLVGLMEDSRTRRGAEAIVGQIFKPGRESAIREVKRALKDKPQVWNNLRGVFLARTMESSKHLQTQTARRVLIGSEFSNSLDKMGEKTLSEIFTKQELKEIRNVAAIGQRSQLRPKGGGAMLIQLTQASAVVGLVAMDFDKAAGVVLLGPLALAHLMLNPRGIRWLTVGLKTPAATKDAVAVAGRLITEAIRSGGSEDIQIQPY